MALAATTGTSGIIAGLQVPRLAAFVQCLGREQFSRTSHSQDPQAVFYWYLSTADMKASGRWRNVPSRFAYDQPEPEPETQAEASASERQQTITATLTLNSGLNAA
jgi:hypothetical protein